MASISLLLIVLLPSTSGCLPRKHDSRLPLAILIVLPSNSRLARFIGPSIQLRQTSANVYRKVEWQKGLELLCDAHVRRWYACQNM
ncbi:hypothetical protein V8C26DRAFT_401253 [Trichoderma gracile]